MAVTEQDMLSYSCFYLRKFFQEIIFAYFGIHWGDIRQFFLKTLLK